MKSPHYMVWAVERTLKRLVSALVLLPIILLLFPIRAMADGLGRLYYKWRWLP